jgi:hypothetical protein
VCIARRGKVWMLLERGEYGLGAGVDEIEEEVDGWCRKRHGGLRLRLVGEAGRKGRASALGILGVMVDLEGCACVDAQLSVPGAANLKMTWWAEMRRLPYGARAHHGAANATPGPRSTRLLSLIIVHVHSDITNPAGLRACIH